jgi:hypothetical protein
MKKYYLHLLSKMGQQQFVNSETDNDKKLKKLQTEGWIVELTKEYTDIRLAKKDRELLLQSHVRDGRMIV